MILKRPWVWFRGTDNGVWTVFNDGSRQSKPGNNATNSTPFVTADGWVWFQGTDNALYSMRTDGSQRSKPGNYTTKASPVVTADGWVWFQGTNNALYRIRTDGSQLSRPGANDTKASPFVTADGWVWFQGTDDALWRMKTDGSQQSRPGNATTLSTPFVTADGWVWFQGPDNALCRMKTDGSELSKPGNATTLTSPTVSASGWVYFQGTDYYLWRMFSDGSQKIVVDGNWTASGVAVTPMTVVNGIPGEWAYWRGTQDNKLWKDFVPAGATGTETAAVPYYVLTLAYAPPGTEGGNSSSSVQYSTASSTGTTTSTSDSFKTGMTVQASTGGLVDIGGSFSASASQTDSSSLQVTKSQGYSFELDGPDVDGIDHDHDLFVLLLNPTVTATGYGNNYASWSMGVDGPTGLVYLVYAGQLKGTVPWDEGTKKALDGRGLTQDDYNQILSLSPFADGSGKIDPNRFLSTRQSVPYKAPATKNSQPAKTSLILTNEQIQTETRDVEFEYKMTMEVGISFFKVSNELAWTVKNTTEKSANVVTVGGRDGGWSSVRICWPGHRPDLLGYAFQLLHVRVSCRVSFI